MKNSQHFERSGENENLTAVTHPLINKKRKVEKTLKFLSTDGPLCVLPTVALHTFLSKYVCFVGFWRRFSRGFTNLRN